MPERGLDEQPAGLLKVPAVVAVRLEGGVLLLDDPLDQLAGDRLAGVEGGLVEDPLPDLRPGDLGGGRVLHQVVDRGRAVAGEPGLEVADADPDVAAQPGLGALTGSFRRPRAGPWR